MTSAPPAPAVPQEKSVFIQRLFTTIAPRYDWFNRLASLNLDQRWRRRAVAASELTPGMRVLDVCTGSGDLALMCAAAQTSGRGIVVGLDFNDAMLHTASSKLRGAETAVWWIRGDAQRLPFASQSFDRLFIGFSTRNLSDVSAGVREMLRVLKAGGRLVILETGRPSNPVVRAAYFAALFTVARVVGLLVTGRLWPFTYLARSVKGFLRPDQMVALLTASGARAWYQPLSWGIASLYVADKPA
ncbi:MAG: ubiquinone/menaquinone biosynthesis methyltransferase [Candidatus Omnitrophica bacterium]|nr:ubiquinone/menaquinone biosynthesis methyltransferase [Candidatus Omnitrophota bacterium]